MIFELEPGINKSTLRFTYDGIVPENEFGRLTQIGDPKVVFMEMENRSFTAFIEVAKSPQQVFERITRDLDKRNVIPCANRDEIWSLMPSSSI